MATLWSVYDDFGARMMIEFYRQLIQNPTMPKSEVLRQAQIHFLKHPNYGHPVYWAPYLLLGNWL
ncbi:CHAT domain-containing protein [Leptolyngbya sp. FACHB-711]|nr:CHAT domain-containing protein [Leptolyngbya sp. FACHB-711]